MGLGLRKGSGIRILGFKGEGLRVRGLGKGLKV